MAKPRPKHLNVFVIRQPIPAIVSILHRVSGILTFLFLWFFLSGLQRSLASPESFMELKAIMAHPVMKIVLLGLAWAYLHHFFAGLRHLALDLRIGIELPKARAMAWGALVISLAGTALVGVLIW
jgi:succinate dehydrogenase / fumarate reductase cytochrome b subunit